MEEIVVISDTHARTLEQLPQEILQAVRNAEWVVHCGDFTQPAVLEGLKKLAKNFVAVYGNADPADIRNRLPSKTTFEFQGKRIGVIHPHWGGYPHNIEAEVSGEFEEVDVILFGHTHEPCNTSLGRLLLLNPGQGYAQFMVPASLGILTVSRDGVKGEILTLK